MSSRQPPPRRARGMKTFVFCPFCECRQQVPTLAQVEVSGYECRFCYMKVPNNMIISKGVLRGEKRREKAGDDTRVIREGKIRVWGQAD